MSPRNSRRGRYLLRLLHHRLQPLQPCSREAPDSLPPDRSMSRLPSTAYVTDHRRCPRHSDSLQSRSPHYHITVSPLLLTYPAVTSTNTATTYHDTMNSRGSLCTLTLPTMLLPSSDPYPREHALRNHFSLFLPTSYHPYNCSYLLDS